MNVTELLTIAIKKGASDLHLSSGLAPLFRIDGELKSFNHPTLSHQEVANMIESVMNHQQRKEYNEQLDIDFSFNHNELARFRVNAFTQTRGAAAVFRIIPTTIPNMDELHLPIVFHKIAALTHGLVLVTGPTGSGKSTTLAAIIDHLNTTRHQHIITIEDPIEFLHHSKNCLVNQREVRRDTHSFNSALRSTLREDPDIILVGELRDLESIRLAITAAETGHLVFATLHTSSAPKTINRIIDVFPGEEKAIIRSMLSESLQAVIAQSLLPRKAGGRIAAFEIMICNPAIRNLIREDKITQLYSTLQTGKLSGMQTLDQDLMQLLTDNRITREIAREAAVYKEHFQC